VTARDYTPHQTSAIEKKRPRAEEADYPGRRKRGKGIASAVKAYNKTPQPKGKAFRVLSLIDSLHRQQLQPDQQDT
jgi:hypothetical protein